MPLGAQITVSGVPGAPTLTVVGYASSINRSADGWVVPNQIAALRASRTSATAQMLYRFASAGRCDVAGDVGCPGPHSGCVAR